MSFNFMSVVTICSDFAAPQNKVTRPFRYDLNQIPYNHTVEVRNTFKGLELIGSLKNCRWRFMTLYKRW